MLTGGQTLCEVRLPDKLHNAVNTNGTAVINEDIGRVHIL